MSAGGAAKMLRVIEHSIPVAIHAGIFALGLHVGAADLDRAQFVCTDAAVKNLLLARLRIEEPLSVLFAQRDRKGPGVGAELED